jgi:hypothetical protein
MAISILSYISRSPRIIKQRERQRAILVSSAVHSYLRLIHTAAIFIHLILDVREIYYRLETWCSRDFSYFMTISISIYISRSSRIIKQRERQRAKRAIASYTGIIRRPSYLRSIHTAGGCRLFFTFIYLVFERFIIHSILHVREIYYRLETSCARDLL